MFSIEKKLRKISIYLLRTHIGTYNVKPFSEDSGRITI